MRRKEKLSNSNKRERSSSCNVLFTNRFIGQNAGKFFFPAGSSKESATVTSAGGRCLDRASAAPIEPGGVDRDLLRVNYTAEFLMKAPLTCESFSSSYCQTAYSPPRPNPETFRSPPCLKQRARPRQWRQRTTEAPPSSFPVSRDRESPLRMAVGAVEAKQEAGSAAAGRGASESLGDASRPTTPGHDEDNVTSTAY